MARFFFLCQNFGPDPAPHGLSEASTLRCQDANVPLPWAPRWVWTADGKRALGAEPATIDALPAVKFDRTGETIAVYKWQ